MRKERTTPSNWAKYRSRQDAYRLRKVADGICYDCTDPVAPNNKWRCERHAERVNAVRRKG